MKLKYLDVGDNAGHAREIIFSFEGDGRKVRICQIFERGKDKLLVANKLAAMADEIRSIADRNRQEEQPSYEETNRGGFPVNNASYWRREHRKLQEKIDAIVSICTTDFETKECFIDRVRRILYSR